MISVPVGKHVILVITNNDDASKIAYIVRKEFLSHADKCIKGVKNANDRESEKAWNTIRTYRKKQQKHFSMV
jgi:hypothetical protein